MPWTTKFCLTASKSKLSKTENLVQNSWSFFESCIQWPKSIQIQTSKKEKNIQYLSCIITDATYHIKQQIDKGTSQLKFRIDSKSKSGKYKIKTICDSVIYAKKSKVGGHLPDFYYLDMQKTYPKEKNIQQPVFTI